MKALSIVSLVFAVILAISLTSLAAEPAEPAKYITGYGNYKLGTPMADLDLTSFKKRWTDKMGMAYYLREDGGTMTLGNYSTDYQLALGALDGKLEYMVLDFVNLAEFRNIDSVGNFVKLLNEAIQQRYDPRLVDEDYFHYEFNSGPGESWWGLLQLSDHYENRINLSWHGYKLSLWYISAKADKLAKSALEAERSKSTDKL